MRLRDWDQNLKVRLFGEALMNITFWMFFPFLTIYFAESFGKGNAGLLLVISQLFSVFANLMGGYTADRFGRKRMMVISAFGQGIAFLVFAFAVSPWYTSPMLGFVCFTLVGMFGAVYWPASQAMVADVVPEKDRSSVFAIFYTSINIAVVIGPILGAIFYAKYRFELLVAVGIISILLSLVLAKWTRETVPASSQFEKTTGGKWYHFLKKQLADYAIIVQDRIFLLFIIAGVLAAATFMQLDLLFPVYTKETITNQSMFAIGSWNFTLNGEQAFGLILSENGLLVALFTVAVTKWMLTFRERNVFVLSSLVYAAAILMFGATSSIWGLVAAMGVFTLAELMVAGLQQSFISNLAPEHMRGQYFAAASLRYTLGRTIAPISIPLTVWIGYGWTFTILSILAVCSAGLFWIMFALYEKKRDVDKAM
jgi:DHA1 family multidrug resistance protein B-like MFS transporter